MSRPRQRISGGLDSTVSTKLSTDQLICKSPPSTVSSRSDPERPQDLKENEDQSVKERTPIQLYLGVLQILFGMLMAVFGVMVLVHDSNLSQIGGGLWGGCLAALTGVMGVFSVAKDCCPLKSNFQRVAHTVFLALSLVSLAVSHLVLVIACIGLTRDTSKNDFTADENPEEISGPLNHLTILANAGLLVVSALECVAAAMSAYHSSRAICPCFKRGSVTPQDEQGPEYLSSANKNMLVSSWLGKQPQQIYAVVQGKMNSKGMTKMQMAPVFTVTPPPSLLPPSVLGYPLIPAPLGSTPPPILPPGRPHVHRERIHRKRKRYPNDRQLQRISPDEKIQKKKKKKEKKTITEEEVAKTYTGLDRVIAEEFIEICEKGHSGSDCTSNGDTTSNEGGTVSKT